MTELHAANVQDRVRELMAILKTVPDFPERERYVKVHLELLRLLNEAIRTSVRARIEADDLAVELQLHRPTRADLDPAPILDGHLYATTAKWSVICAAVERIEVIRHGYGLNRFYEQSYLQSHDAALYRRDCGRIHWVTVRGESGLSPKPTHPEWVRAIRDQCVAAHVPFFFSGWGDWVECEKRGERQIYAMTFGRPQKIVYADGRQFDYRSNWDGSDDGVAMERVGGKAASRLLDGREWVELPEGTDR